MSEDVGEQDLPDSASTSGDKDHFRYLSEIQSYEKEAGPWEDKGKKIIDRYKNERKNPNDKKKRFNILWSMKETLGPALYMQDPKVDISRRFTASGDVGRVTADILEKCTSYFVAEAGFGSVMRKARDGYLLPGRGQAWVRYVPHMRDVKLASGEAPAESEKPGYAGPQVTDEQDPQNDPLQEVYWEEVAIDFVHFDDFGHNLGRTWEEIWVVWRRVFLDKDELKGRFPKNWHNIPLDHTQKKVSGKPQSSSNPKATIYELWDKKRDVAVWLHKDVPDLLDKREDPLKLQGFFPCPEPMIANPAEDSCLPNPDFLQYQDQALQLDDLTARISSISRSLKVVGVRDASAQGLDRMLSEGVENTLVPVDQWAVFAEKGGIKGVVDWFPLDMVVAALKELYEVYEKVKEQLYELTGIADIMRGVSDPDETAAAQKIKGNFGNMRLQDRQRRMHEFARDVVRIMGEIIATHFSVACLKQISGVKIFDSKQQKAEMQQLRQQSQPPQPQQGQQPDLQAAMMAQVAGQMFQAKLAQIFPEIEDQEEIEELFDSPTWEDVEKLLRDEPGRRFRLGIETNSTIKQDEESEKAARVQFIDAVGGFIKESMAAVQQQPLLMPLIARLLMFGVRAFPVGKELEETFKLTIAKLEKEADNPQPKPDPEMAKVHAQAAIEQQKLQANQQQEAARVQADGQIEQQRLRHEHALEAMRLQYQQKADADAQKWQQWQVEQQNKVEMHAKALEAQQNAAIERMKAEMKAQTDIILAHIKAAAQIESSRVTAKYSNGEDAENREASGEA